MNKIHTDNERKASLLFFLERATKKKKISVTQSCQMKINMFDGNAASAKGANSDKIKNQVM